jgi:hypothetical protein
MRDEHFPSSTRIVSWGAWLNHQGSPGLHRPCRSGEHDMGMRSASQQTESEGPLEESGELRREVARMVGTICESSDQSRTRAYCPIRARPTSNSGAIGTSNRASLAVLGASRRFDRAAASRATCSNPDTTIPVYDRTARK